LEGGNNETHFAEDEERHTTRTHSIGSNTNTKEAFSSSGGDRRGRRRKGNWEERNHLYYLAIAKRTRAVEGKREATFDLNGIKGRDSIRRSPGGRKGRTHLSTSRLGEKPFSKKVRDIQRQGDWVTGALPVSPSPPRSKINREEKIGRSEICQHKKRGNGTNEKGSQGDPREKAIFHRRGGPHV